MGTKSNMFQDNNECQRRYFGQDSFVCVCNANFCDKFPSLDIDYPNDEALIVTSSRSGDRFKKSTLKWKKVQGKKSFVI